MWFVWARASACSVCAAAWLGREIHPAACCRSSAELGLRLVVEAATDPNDAKRCTGFTAVALPSYALITLTNAAFGGVCYCMFAEETQSNVLENLQGGTPAVAVIQVLLCVDLLFTIPMVLAAGRELCEGGSRSCARG